MREDDEAAPPRPRLVERICEDASGCEEPARRGPYCYAHAQRRKRGSKKLGPIARHHPTPWHRLSEAAIVHGDAMPVERARTKERLRKAARVFSKWVRAGGKRFTSPLDALRLAARAYVEAPVVNGDALKRARARLLAAVDDSRLSAWERLEAAAIAYSDADPSDDKGFRRASARLREAACGFVRWERAGGHE